MAAVEAPRPVIPAVEVVDVSLTYQTVQGDHYQALRGVHLEIRPEEFHSIVGPSGCGKSSLLSLVAGLHQPTAGQIRIEGRPLQGPMPDKIGVVFQESTLFPWLTLLRNVAFQLELRGVPRAQREARATELIELVGLRGFEKALPRELSGGMQQRACIARALAAEPDILLMDEPFGALDEQTRQSLGEELLRIWEYTRKTIIFVTHSLQESIFLADRITVLGGRPGHVLETLTADLSRPRTPDTLAEPAFQNLLHRVWRLIRDEGELRKT